MAKSAPKQIRDQAEEADRLQREALGLVEDAANPAGAVEPAAAVEPAPEPPAAPEPEPAPEPPAAPEPAPANVVTEDETWQHRYNVLKGKYDKEVPRLNGELRALRGQIENMQVLLAQMQQQPPRSDPAAAAPPAQSSITDEERAEYGEEFFDLVRRTSNDTFAPALTEIKDTLAGLQRQLGQTTNFVATSAKDRFYAQLGQLVENWQEVNKNEEFHAWLEQVDPYAGRQRGQLMLAAFENNDAPRVAAFFNGFLNEHATISSQVAEPAPAPAPAPPTGARTTAPGVALETLAAPGKGRGTEVDARQTQPQGTSRVWTQAGVRQFYEDVRKGAFAGRDAERAALENEIFAAANSGQLQP